MALPQGSVTIQSSQLRSVAVSAESGCMRSSFLSWRSTSSSTGFGILAFWALSRSCAISSPSSLPSPSSDWIAFSCWRRKNSRWLRSISPLACEEISCCMVRTSSSLVMSSWTRRSRSTGSSGLEDLLRALDLQVEVGGGEVGEPARLLHVVGDDDDLGRDRLAEVLRLLERGLDVAHQGLDLERALLGALRLGHRLDARLQVGQALVEGDDAGAADALHEHADAAVGQLQHAHDEGGGAHRVDVVGPGVVLVLLLLRGEQDHAVLGERLVDGLDRAVAAHVEGHDHEREDDDVPQRQHRQHLRDLGLAPRPCGSSLIPGAPSRWG